MTLLILSTFEDAENCIRENTLLKFLKMGTSDPHPEAALPEVVLPRCRIWTKEAQLLDNLLAISRNDPSTRSMETVLNEVIDWKTGKNIAVGYLNYFDSSI